MAFDSTISGTAANSYVTVTSCDDYMSLRYENDLWPVTTPLKERIIVTAVRRLDSEAFGGTITDDDQALQWPREDVFDRNSVVYANTAIPQNLINAVCEMAYFILEDECRVAGDQALHDMENLSGLSTTIDGNSINYTIRAGAKANKLPQKVQQELKAIGQGAWKGGQKVTRLAR